MRPSRVSRHCHHRPSRSVANPNSLSLGKWRMRRLRTVFGGEKVGRWAQLRIPSASLVVSHVEKESIIRSSDKRPAAAAVSDSAAINQRTSLLAAFSFTIHDVTRRRSKSKPTAYKSAYICFGSLPDNLLWL